MLSPGWTSSLTSLCSNYYHLNRPYTFALTCISKVNCPTFGKNLKNFRPFCFPSPKLAKIPKRKILDFSSKPKNIFSVKENFLFRMHICTAFCNGATQQMVIPHRIEPFSLSSSLSSPPLPIKSYWTCQSSFYDCCEACLRSKPNTAPDRGILSAIPIPHVANDTLFIDFHRHEPPQQF